MRLEEGARSKLGLTVRGNAHQSDDRRQDKIQVMEGGSRCLFIPGTFLRFLFHIFQVQSAWKLGKMKGMNLEELWLKGNSLFGTFPNQSTYVRSVVISVTLPGDLCTLGA